MRAGRQVAALVWVLLVVGYMLAHKDFSQWWLFKTVLIASFVGGLIWPTSEEKEKPEEN